MGFRSRSDTFMLGLPRTKHNHQLHQWHYLRYLLPSDSYKGIQRSSHPVSLLLPDLDRGMPDPIKPKCWGPSQLEASSSFSILRPWSLPVPLPPSDNTSELCSNQLQPPPFSYAQQSSLTTTSLFPRPATALPSQLYVPALGSTPPYCLG